MTNITVRNIPDEIVEKLRTLSEVEKRSLNSEILLILEKGVMNSNIETANFIPKEIQIKLWKQFSGKWKDDRATDEIIEDIYSSRTEGREHSL